VPLAHLPHVAADASTRPAFTFESQSHSSGWCLLESLIALLVLSVGLLALVPTQTQMLAASRSALQFGQAMALGADLRERMQANRVAALQGHYTHDWNSEIPEMPALPAPTASTVLPLSPQPAGQCIASECSPKQLAAFDLRAWLQQVRGTLPDGMARIFVPAQSPEQIGILIAWTTSRGDVLPPTAGCPPQALCQLSHFVP